MSGLFPRENPNQSGSFDHGKLRTGDVCLRCSSKQHVSTVSLEFCNECGYFTDYWGNTEQFKGHQELIDRAMLFVHLEEMIQEWAEKNSHMLRERVSLTIEVLSSKKTIILA